MYFITSHGNVPKSFLILRMANTVIPCVFKIFINFATMTLRNVCNPVFISTFDFASLDGIIKCFYNDIIEETPPIVLLSRSQNHRRSQG